MHTLYSAHDLMVKFGRQKLLLSYIRQNYNWRVFVTFDSQTLKLIQNLPDNIHAISDSVLDEICRALENLNLSESIEAEEFLTVPEEEVY